MKRMRGTPPLLPLIIKQLFDDTEGSLYNWDLYMEDPYRLHLPRGISESGSIDTLIDRLDEMLKNNPENVVKLLSTAFRMGLHVAEGPEKVGRKTSLLKKAYPDVDVDLVRLIIVLSNVNIYSIIMFGLAHCGHRGSRWGCELAKVLAEIGSQKFKGIEAELFSELAKAIERGDWNSILREACRLHYLFSAYNYVEYL